MGRLIPRLLLLPPLGFFLGTKAFAATLTASPSLFPIETCLIRSLSFSSPTRGWVTDSCGDAFESKDGGLTWKKLAPDRGLSDGSRDALSIGWFSPTQGLAFSQNASIFTSRDAGASWQLRGKTGLGWTDEVKVLNSKVWWCGKSGLMMSIDRGQSWQSLTKSLKGPIWCRDISLVSENRFSFIDDNKRSFITKDGGKSWSPSQTESPKFDKVRRDDQVSVVLDENEYALEFRSKERMLQKVPLLEYSPYLGREAITRLPASPLNKDNYAWSTRHLYKSLDQGRNWYVVSTFPNEAQRLAILDDGRLLVDTDDGLWKAALPTLALAKSTNESWDRHDLKKKLGLPSFNPLAIKLQSPRCRLIMKSELIGCFNHESEGIELNWDRPQSATLSSDKYPRFQLPLSELDAILQEISADVDRNDRFPDCYSTTHKVAQIDIDCEGEQAFKLEFTDRGCSSSANDQVSEFYSRAFALDAVIKKLSERASMPKQE